VHICLQPVAWTYVDSLDFVIWWSGGFLIDEMRYGSRIARSDPESSSYVLNADGAKCYSAMSRVGLHRNPVLNVFAGQS
jgi:hypothetical protein